MSVWIAILRPGPKPRKRWGFDLEKLYAKNPKKIKRCRIKFLKKFYRKIYQDSKEYNKANQNCQIDEILYDYPENS
jgi:hypothetical protein